MRDCSKLSSVSCPKSAMAAGVFSPLLLSLLITHSREIDPVEERGVQDLYGDSGNKEVVTGQSVP